MDLILIGSKKNENDDLILCKEEELGTCFIESKNLDGETNLKFKQAHKDIAIKYRKEEDYDNLNGMVVCTAPNEIINDFGGRYYENIEDKTNFLQIEKKSLLLRGCSLRQTNCIYGISVYIGHNTKMMKNFPTIKNKKSSIETKLNKDLFFLIILDLIICLIFSALTYIYKTVRIFEY